VLAAAKTASPQMAAFIFLPLDTGARTSELHGLTWPDVDLETGVLTIARQLDAAGAVPVWEPTKTKKRRTITLGAETVAQLRAHKRAQSALKMKNRTAYKNVDLIFAKEPVDLQTPKAALGQPLNTLSESRFQTLVKAADVRRIKFHGVRHTVATLSLQEGTPPHVVAA
jgi:integrase